MSGRETRPGGLEVIIERLALRYEYDVNGRIACVRGEGFLPRFVLGRAAEGCIWRFAAKLESECVTAISRLAGRESGFPSAGEKPSPPPERLAMIERLLAANGIDVEARHEILTSDGVEIAEIWTMD